MSEAQMERNGRGVAWVTGASSGIGWASALVLAREGFTVAASARNRTALDALAEKEESIHAFPLDVADPVRRGEVHEAIVAELGPVDLLVNNAGYGARGAVEEMAAHEVRNMMDVNVMAPHALARLVLPGMRERGRGRIVNVGSVVGRVAFPFSGLYSASKHALAALSDAMRIELRPFGVQVVQVEPGPIATRFAEMARRNSLARLVDGGSPYADAYRRLMGGSGVPRSWRWPASTVAWAVFRAATASAPKARYPVHGLAWVLPPLVALLPRSLSDRLFARAFGIEAEGSP